MSSTKVLSFHRVSDEESPSYPPIPIKVFDKICKYISKHYEVIHPNALFDENKSRKAKVLITFDDAYLDFYEHALPILNYYKIPVIQHVITSCAELGEPFWTQRLNKIIDTYYKDEQSLIFKPLRINKTLKDKGQTEQVALAIYKNLLNNSHRKQLIQNLEVSLKSEVKHTKMMTWNHIKDVASDDVVIGSHTHSHSNLTILSDDNLNDELLNSKKLIQLNIPNQKKWFLAYPNGQCNKKVVQKAKAIGYDAAFSIEDKDFDAENNRFQVPRYHVYHNNWWKNYLRFKVQIK